jgi:hypothetical protein
MIQRCLELSSNVKNRSGNARKLPSKFKMGLKCHKINRGVKNRPGNATNRSGSIKNYQFNSKIDPEMLQTDLEVSKTIK